MTLCIRLTEAQAAEVYGAARVGGAFLEPVLLADGLTWFLPKAVLDDPDHSEHHALLSALPEIEVQPGDLAEEQRIPGVAIA